MVKLKKTGRFIGRNGQISVIDENRLNIGETWIHAGSHFDTAPMVGSHNTEPFRLPTNERLALLDEGYRLWKYDALGGTIVSLTTYFVLGRGVTFTFDDENAQFYAEKFFKRNNLEMRLRAASDESVAFGEMFIWLRPHYDTVMRNGKVLWRPGDTQVTFIEPRNITNVETAPEDATDVFGYIYEYIDGERESHVERIPDISKYEFNADSSQNGCMIHIKLNAGNMDPFGHSDLIRVKEWLDNYQEYLRDGVVINKLYRSPCFDISIEDATAADVSAAVARYRSWTIGSNPVHNSKEQWQILEFTGPNTSSENSRRALLLIIAAGVNFAEYMLADGSNANLASSKSQQLPVIKKFEDRQDIFAYHIMMMLQFALRAKGVINTTSGLNVETDLEGDPKPFEGSVKFPAIAEERDVEIAQTNQQALDGKYMSPRTAAGRLGLDYSREVDIMKKDQVLVDELTDIGVIKDPTEEAMKLEQIKSDSNKPDEGKPDEGKPDESNRQRTSNTSA